MEVKNVYQDRDGKWHIDYGYNHLIGLAFRVYAGQFLLGLTIFIFLIILSILFGFTLANSLPESKNTPSFPYLQPKSSCNSK
ncbi:MAG: hypothetical protein ACFCU5_18910 [Pleurocapsa sp.]